MNPTKANQAVNVTVTVTVTVSENVTVKGLQVSETPYPVRHLRCYTLRV
jgi:hypothetical protein